MKIYECKVRGKMTSDECDKCFKEYDTKQSSRPLCVKENVTKTEEVPNTQTQKEPAMSSTKTPASPAAKPITVAKPFKTGPALPLGKPAKEKKERVQGPFRFQVDLLLQRKFTDAEILAATAKKFPGWTKGYLSVIRSHINKGEVSGISAPAQPIHAIKDEKEVKAEKPATKTPAKAAEKKPAVKPATKKASK